MAVPDFPTDHPHPPREPVQVRTAVLLALFFGPLGLMYTSIGAGLFMLFLMVVLGLFTVGMGILPVWGLCVAWAYLAATHARDHHAPPGDGDAG
ncbi:hypothetical protein [Longimicrobium sp.]|uniref:hypothetical protein n=1 Tax=Longimicrobium sp. TaxID=2029185 RepID=UPI002B88B208|nr:hypothetical protein [Longimicrobium sp.]HSU15935.1 hypothetical protein [Longimicrobium sp.]